MLVGWLFDTRGRRPMIAFTYITSGVALAATGFLFMRDLISAETQTLCWTAIFFFGSAAASSAYLTVSETFPLEVRALAIAFFYAVGTAVGGIVGPWLFEVLIDMGERLADFLDRDFEGVVERSIVKLIGQTVSVVIQSLWSEGANQRVVDRCRKLLDVRTMSAPAKWCFSRPSFPFDQGAH